MKRKRLQRQVGRDSERLQEKESQKQRQAERDLCEAEFERKRLELARLRQRHTTSLESFAVTGDERRRKTRLRFKHLQLSNCERFSPR